MTWWGWALLVLAGVVVFLTLGRKSPAPPPPAKPRDPVPSPEAVKQLDADLAAIAEQPEAELLGYADKRWGGKS